MTFEQEWIEYDYNPFILFDSKGKILSLNSEAQFLLGFTNPHEIFELAKTYASVSFGFKTTFVALEYGRYKFFGVTVGYRDEEQIGIKLYQAPSYKLKIKKPEGELVSIYAITDLCIATNSINSDIEFTKIYDPTLPDIRIDSNALIKVLNKIYDTLKESKTIQTKVFFRVGEHLIFEDKKYSIASIAIYADVHNTQKNSEIETLAENSNIHLEIKNSTYTISLPMIDS